MKNKIKAVFPGTTMFIIWENVEDLTVTNGKVSFTTGVTIASSNGDVKKSEVTLVNMGVVVEEYE